MTRHITINGVFMLETTATLEEAIIAMDILIAVMISKEYDTIFPRLVHPRTGVNMEELTVLVQTVTTTTKQRTTGS